MAARARSNGKAPSAAEKRRARQAATEAARKQEAQREQQQVLVQKLQNAHAWLRGIKGQRAEIAEQRAEMDKRDAELADAQQQAVGRVATFEELLGTREALPDITQQAQPPAATPDPTDANESEAEMPEPKAEPAPS